MLTHVVMTHFVMRLKEGGDGAIRVTLMEPYQLLQGQGRREYPAAVAYFAGAETVRQWRAPQRYRMCGDAWRAARSVLIADFSADWKMTDIRWGAYATRTSFGVALGGRVGDILGCDPDDGYDYLTAGTEHDGARYDRRSNLEYHWRNAYGHLAAGDLQKGPLPSYAVMPSRGGVLAGPPQPIKVSEYAFQTLGGHHDYRLTIVENESCLRPNGQFMVGAAIVLFRGYRSFALPKLWLMELPVREWADVRDRRLRSFRTDGTETGRSEANFPSGAAFVDAVGSRLVRAIGGKKALDLLAPVEVPAPFLPLRTMRVATASADDVQHDDDDPMFGAF